MAMPILFNFRAIQKEDKNRFFFALSSYALDDSGILFELEYDDAHENPWGVLINGHKGSDFGYFTNLSDDKKQIISAGLSSYLNAGHGFDENNKPIALPLSEILKITEKVLTLRSFEDGKFVEIITVADSQKELVDVLSSLEFFKGGVPEHVTNPPALIDNSIKKDS